MPYRIAICDDQTPETEYLTALVSRWAEARNFSVQIDAFSSAERFLFHSEDAQTYDILLLDIELGGISGVELAKQVRRTSKTVQIIFVTGYADYILDGYEVEALHYLMKPVSEQKLLQVLDRAAEKLKHSEKLLTLDLNQELVCIPLHEIRFLEVRQNYVTVHAEQDYTVKKPLSELEKSLDAQFFRTGRSFIVNMKYIHKVTRSDVYLKDGTAVPLSRGLYDPLNRAIIQYF